MSNLLNAGLKNLHMAEQGGADLIFPDKAFVCKMYDTLVHDTKKPSFQYWKDAMSEAAICSPSNLVKRV